MLREIYSHKSRTGDYCALCGEESTGENLNIRPAVLGHFVTICLGCASDLGRAAANVEIDAATRDRESLNA